MLVDYEPEHLINLEWQPQQAGYGSSRVHAEAVAQGYSAYTVLQDGMPVICAGLMELWKGRAMAWAAFDYRADGHSLLIAHRRIQRELARAPFRRLEMYVKPGFLEAWRWAEMLGFTLESTMRAGAPNGGDLFVFVRLNGRSAFDALTGKQNAIRNGRPGRGSGSRRNGVGRGREQSARI